jgi:hypothetical protein
MFSMSHNNGVVTNLRCELLFEYEDSPLDEDDGGVGGFNHTPHLVKPLVPFKVSLILESWVIFVMNITPKPLVEKLYFVACFM